MQLKCLIDGVREDEDERTIYIETLPADVKREQVTKIFKRFGKIAYISVPRFPGGACKGFGFVEYRDVEAAEEALKAVRGKQMSESDFPNLRALPRAEWRRRKEEYKDQRHSVQVANAKAKKRVREDSQEGQAEDRGTTTPANALPVVNPDEDVNGVVEETILPTACAAEEEHSVENQCESTPTPPKSINDPGQASTRDDDTVESRGGNPVDAKSPSPLSYESGLILSIDGLQNAKERMTRHIVSASLEQYGKVAFLDLPVKAPHKCRARFATAEGAQIAEAALAPSGGGTIAGVAVTASVLKDKDESDYWIKIRKRRESKRSRNSNKESEKVARKAVRRVAPRKQPTRTKKGD